MSMSSEVLIILCKYSVSSFCVTECFDSFDCSRKICHDHKTEKGYFSYSFNFFRADIGDIKLRLFKICHTSDEWEKAAIAFAENR